MIKLCFVDYKVQFTQTLSGLNPCREFWFICSGFEICPTVIFADTPIWWMMMNGVSFVALKESKNATKKNDRTIFYQRNAQSFTFENKKETKSKMLVHIVICDYWISVRYGIRTLLNHTDVTARPHTHLLGQFAVLVDVSYLVAAEVGGGLGAGAAVGGRLRVAAVVVAVARGGLALVHGVVFGGPLHRWKTLRPAVLTREMSQNMQEGW